jgi:flavodoxin
MRVDIPGSGLTDGKKTLVVYFSHSGNTREIAGQIHQRVGGDIFEIQTLAPYPRDYDAVIEQAKKEKSSGYKPPLRTRVEDMTPYELIFIGYPIWWGTIPPPVITFLSAYDLSGKTVIPFCTHGGSALGRSMTDVSRLCPKSTVLDGIAVFGRDVKTAQGKVSEWLREMRITN